MDALLAGRAHARHEVLLGRASRPSTLLDDDDDDDDVEVDDEVDELELAEELDEELLEDADVDDEAGASLLLPPPQPLNNRKKCISSADATDR